MENKIILAAEDNRTKETKVRMCGQINNTGNWDSTMEYNNMETLPQDATMRTTIEIKCRKSGSKWKDSRQVNHKTMNQQSTTVEGTKEVRAQKISGSLEMTGTQFAPTMAASHPVSNCWHSTDDDAIQYIFHKILISPLESQYCLHLCAFEDIFNQQVNGYVNCANNL